MNRRRISALMIVLCLVIGMSWQTGPVHVLADETGVIYTDETGVSFSDDADVTYSEGGLFMPVFIRLDEDTGIYHAQNDNAASFLSDEVSDFVCFTAYSADAKELRGPNEGDGHGFYDKLDATGKQIYAYLADALDEYTASEEFTSKNVTKDGIAKGEVQGSVDVNIPIAKLVKSDGSDDTTFDLEDSDDVAKINEDVMSAFVAHYEDSYGYYWLSPRIGGRVNYLEDCYVCTMYLAEDFYTLKSRQEAAAAVEFLTSEWMTLLSSYRAEEGVDDYLVALRLHDLIIERVNYTYNSYGKPEQAQWAHSIAGIATGQGAVCEAYAKTFSYFLNLLGIENQYIIGLGKKENHAWNAIELDGEYYLIDVTWDDPNESANDDKTSVDYDYFCIPKSAFGTNHKPEKKYHAGDDWSEKSDYMFYKYFKSYADTDLTAETAATLRDAALGNQYKYSDYIYFLVTKNSLNSLVGVLGLSECVYYQNALGYVVKYESIKVSQPSATIKIAGEGVEESHINVELRGTAAELVAVIDEGSDDRVSWSVEDPKVAKIVTNGKKVSVTGLRNGTTRLIAETYAGKATDEIEIIIGTGVPTVDYRLWLGGTNEYKKVKLTPDISARNWTDSKGKTKAGKLVYLASDTDIDISFDTSKHTVKNKTTKTVATVNNKGEVSAKKEGTSYIYVCDTGSMTYERYEVEVVSAASKLYICNVPGPYTKENEVKNGAIEMSSSARVYITPVLKNGTVHPDNTFTVQYGDDKSNQYISVSQVKVNDDGYWYFDINARDFDRTKNKVAKAKVKVVNVQSGKSVSLSVSVGNTVQEVTVKAEGTSDSGKYTAKSGETVEKALEAKNSTMQLKLDISTSGGTGLTTTDTFKVMVGKTAVTLKPNGKSASGDSGATVGATYDKKTGLITLKAKKDAGVPAVVVAGFTNQLTKQMSLYTLAVIDENGNVELK